MYMCINECLHMCMDMVYRHAAIAMWIDMVYRHAAIAMCMNIVYRDMRL